MNICSDFLTLLKFKEKIRPLLKKIISDRTKISENINDTEIEYASVEDLLAMQRTASTALIFEISNIFNEESFIIAPGQGKHSV